MKKILIIIMSFLFNLNIIAQNSEVKVRDQFAMGCRILTTDPSCSLNITAFDHSAEKFLEIRPCLNLSVLNYKKEGETKIYTLSLITLSQHSITITSGSLLLFKSIDGKTLELKSSSNQDSRYGHYKSTFDCMYMVIPEYILSEDDVNWFCNNQVQKFRIEFFQGHADADIKPEYDMGFSSIVCESSTLMSKKLESDTNPIYEGF